MISCEELKGSQSLLENALRLLTLEPLNVLKEDLVEKELHKIYHLFARDIHGIFGTATLTERPLRSLENPLKGLLPSQVSTYYELSLLYVTPPNGLEEKLIKNDVECDTLSLRYYHLFYQELFDFLEKKLKSFPLVVTTTEAESRKMSFFGSLSFKYSISHGRNFKGILCLNNENSIDLSSWQNQIENGKTFYH